MKALTDWVPKLGGFAIPALRATVERLAELASQEDQVTARDIANVVLCDPLMTLNVLRYSQSRLRARHPTEVTTVEHAIMMHGVGPFFREFAAPLVLEEVLAPFPDALAGAAGVLSRAYQAALTARHFSALRHDIESEEVLIGALLHDLAELLLWCTEPTTAVQLDHMLQANAGLRSNSAQYAVLGFPLADLQVALAKEWRLPSMLRQLMDDRESGNPRVRTVRVCVAVARHSAHGWFDPALPDDYQALHKLTSLSLEQVRRAVRYCALQSAREWRRFGISPAAAWLPMLPGSAPIDQLSATVLSPAIRQKIVADVIEQLDVARQRRVDERTLLAVAFYGMEAALGLRRIWFGALNERARMIAAKQTLMLDDGIMPSDLSFATGCRSIFDRLLELGQAVFYDPSRTANLVRLIPVHLRERIGTRPFFVMGLRASGRPLGLLYADAGRGPVQLDETGYNGFKHIGLALSKAIEKSTGM